jgi:hypothetical protein
MYAKFLASHIEFRDVLLRADTRDELFEGVNKLDVDGEIARQAIVLIAPHMDTHMARVINERRSAQERKFLALGPSPTQDPIDPLFHEMGEAVTACRKAMSEDLNS